MILFESLNQPCSWRSTFQSSSSTPDLTNLDCTCQNQCIPKSSFFHTNITPCLLKLDLQPDFCEGALWQCLLWKVLEELRHIVKQVHSYVLTCMPWDRTHASFSFWRSFLKNTFKVHTSCRHCLRLRFSPYRQGIQTPTMPQPSWKSF